MMFTDYKVLAAKTPDTLTELVREHMKKGYQPLGGVMASVLDGRINLFQAVVTEAEDQSTMYYQSLIDKLKLGMDSARTPTPINVTESSGTEREIIAYAELKPFWNMEG